MVMPPMVAGEGCCDDVVGVGVAALIPGISSIGSICAGGVVRGAGAGRLVGVRCLDGCLVAGAGFAAGLLVGLGAGIGICMPGSMRCAAAGSGSDAATATVASNV
jgi:hypothetical protein